MEYDKKHDQFELSQRDQELLGCTETIVSNADRGDDLLVAILTRRSQAFVDYVSTATDTDGITDKAIAEYTQATEELDEMVECIAHAAFQQSVDEAVV